MLEKAFRFDPLLSASKKLEAIHRDLRRSYGKLCALGNGIAEELAPMGRSYGFQAGDLASSLDSW